MSIVDEFVSEDLLPIVIDYCNSEDFVYSINKFQEQYADQFHVESKTGEDSGIPHEYHSIFMKYQELIDGHFESLAHKHGFMINSLYKCFRDSVDGKFTALFEEHEYKWFVDKVLSWMDFEQFVKMMRNAKASNRSSRHQHK